MKKILFILFVTTIFSCTNETELSDSVYIQDAEYHELPAYTEWGYNTFGAYYDRSVFIYNDSEVPLKVTLTSDELAFIFQGGDGNYSNDYLALRFILSDFNVNTYEDLLAYNDTIIDLTNEAVVVEMISADNSTVIDIIEGELNFKRAQKVFLDDLEQEIILSGYFNLKFIINDIPSTMSNGRFDFGLNNENFYNLR